MSIYFAEPCAPASWWCARCKAVVRVALVGLREVVCTVCKDLVGEYYERAGLVYPPRH